MQDDHDHHGPDPDAMEERLDELADEEEQVRAQAKEDDVLPRDEDERPPSFHDPKPGYDDPYKRKGGAPG